MGWVCANSRKLNMIRFSAILLFLIISFSSKLHSSEGSTYSFDWLDPDKEVYVLQNRKFRKDGHFYLNLGFAYTFSEAFWDGGTGTLRAGFFFWEEWGLEAVFSAVSGSENTTAESVRGAGGPGSIPFRRITSGYGGLMVWWSPFYSKTNLFNGIVYSDWLIGLGVVSVSDKNNLDEVATGSPGCCEDIKETHTGMIFDVAWQFYIWTKWHLRIDLTSVNYFAEGVNGDSEHFGTWDLGLSIGYRF